MFGKYLRRFSSACLATWRSARSRDLMVAQDLTALLRVPLPDILLQRPSCTLSGTVCTDFNLHGLSSGSLELDSFNCAGSWRCAEDADGIFSATFGRSLLNATAGPSVSCEATTTVKTFEFTSSSASSRAHLLSVEKAMRLDIGQHLGAAACATLNARRQLVSVALLERPKWGTTAKVESPQYSSPDPWQWRLGAQIAFGSLAVLVLSALATLACYCRRKAVDRRARHTRYSALLRQYASEGSLAGGGSNGGGGGGLQSAAELLLPPGPLRSESPRSDSPQISEADSTDLRRAHFTLPRALSKSDGRESISRERLLSEVATLAARQRQAVAHMWSAVAITWLVTAGAATVHMLLAGRLGLLSLTPSSAESPAMEDLGLLLVWAGPPNDAPQEQISALPPKDMSIQTTWSRLLFSLLAGKGDSDKDWDLSDQGGSGPVLAIPLPSVDPLDFNWQTRGDLGQDVKIVIYTVIVTALTPLASLLILLLVLPWTPPDLEPRRWRKIRAFVLYVIEAIGVWSLLPVCLLLLIAATLQMELKLPTIPTQQPSVLHVELSLGCSLTLYTCAAVLTLLAARTAAVASNAPPPPTTSSTSPAPPSVGSSLIPSTCSSAVDLGAIVETPAAGGTSGNGAQPAAAPSASGNGERKLSRKYERIRQTCGAILHALSTIMMLASLQLPALNIKQPTMFRQPTMFEDHSNTKVGIPGLGAKQLSLVDVVAAAAGTPLGEDASVLLHGEWLSASSFCGLARPPPALLSAGVLLLLLVAPPAWRAAGAARAALRPVGAIARPVGRLGAWRLAEVLSAALLAEVALLPSIGPPLMASDLGAALHRFAGVEAIDWRAEWDIGAWLMLSAAACDAAGRLLTC